MELLYDGLDEIIYIKKFTNILQDNRFREFFTLDLLKDQLQADFNKKSENLDQDDPFYFSIYESLSRKLEEDFEAIEQFSKKRKEKFSKTNLLIQSKKKLRIVQILEKIRR